MACNGSMKSATTTGRMSDLSFNIDRVAERGRPFAVTQDDTEPVSGMCLNRQQNTAVVGDGCPRHDFAVPYPLNLLPCGARNRCGQDKLSICRLRNGAAHLPALGFRRRFKLKRQSRYTSRPDVGSTCSQTVQKRRFGKLFCINDRGWASDSAIARFIRGMIVAASNRSQMKTRVEHAGPEWPSCQRAFG